MKKEWVQFVKDINESLMLEPPFSMENEGETIAEIAARQSGEDAFVDADYLPENGIGLKDNTVAWLLENEVEIPENWLKRLEKQKSKAKEAECKIKNRGKIAMALERMQQLIEKKILQKDLIQILVKEFPSTAKSTFRVQLCKAMKKETCQFNRLVVKDENNMLSFEENKDK